MHVFKRGKNFASINNLPSEGYRRRTLRKHSSSKSGQAIIETCIAVGLICLLFFGLFQVSQIFAAKEILHHAAVSGARCATVGFNWFMVRKSVNVASIPNCGNLLEPDLEFDTALHSAMQETPGTFWDWALDQNPASTKFNVEIARIPEYLYSPNNERASYVLNYEGWENNEIHISADGLSEYGYAGIPPTMIDFHVTQTYPLWVPMHKTFYGADTVRLSGESSIETHYSLYMDSGGNEE